MAIYGICVDLELPLVKRFKTLDSALDWKKGEDWDGEGFRPVATRRVFELTLDHVALENIADPAERIDALVDQIEAGKEHNARGQS